MKPTPKVYDNLVGEINNARYGAGIRSRSDAEPGGNPKMMDMAAEMVMQRGGNPKIIGEATLDLISGINEMLSEKGHSSG